LHLPSGAKAPVLLFDYGTAEAVPLSKTSEAKLLRERFERLRWSKLSRGSSRSKDALRMTAKEKSKSKRQKQKAKARSRFPSGMTTKKGNGNDKGKGNNKGNGNGNNKGSKRC
jgi:hypothetical protein